jgi:hypothetical protein
LILELLWDGNGLEGELDDLLVDQSRILKSLKSDLLRQDVFSNLLNIVIYLPSSKLEIPVAFGPGGGLGDSHVADLINGNQRFVF